MAPWVMLVDSALTWVQELHRSADLLFLQGKNSIVVHCSTRNSHLRPTIPEEIQEMAAARRTLDLSSH